MLILDLDSITLEADIFELGKDGVNFRKHFIIGFERNTLKIGRVSEKGVII